MLFVETIDRQILIDPCFANELLDGVLVYNPDRKLVVEKIPTPDILVVTHGHFDHLHWQSLAQLPHALPLLTSNDPPVIRQLQATGFTNVIVCEPWQTVKFGKTRFIATPSEHEEAEIGLLIDDGESRFWHMVDSEVNPSVGEYLDRTYGTPDLVSAKHQPAVSAMMGYVKNMGTEFDKSELVSWLEAACICNPGLVFPYASGICYGDRHRWFNRYAFPLTAAEIVRLLQRRLGNAERATVVMPGDVIEIRSGQPPQKYPQASPFVSLVAVPPVEWEPVDISTLAGVATEIERLDLQQRVEAILSQPLALWLQRQVEQGNNEIANFKIQEVVLQLTIHTGAEQRLEYAIDFRGDDYAATAGKHPEANFFTHFSGQTLYEVITEKQPGVIFWLTGGVRSYEKILGVRDGTFWYPEFPAMAEQRMSDPLSYYLRYFGTGAMSPHEPDLATIEPTPATSTSSDDPISYDLEILIREGGNDEVLSKKALLTYLCLQEAKKIGLEIDDEDLQKTSDAFRSMFALLEEDSTDLWLEAEGMSFDTYVETLEYMATVMKLERHYHDRIAPLIAKHRRMAIATAHLRDRQ
jgi:L-ascorbate metabolism protein UlaG (beta-lactamase superfamily)